MPLVSAASGMLQTLPPSIWTASNPAVHRPTAIPAPTRLLDGEEQSPWVYRALVPDPRHGVHRLRRNTTTRTKRDRVHVRRKSVERPVPYCCSRHQSHPVPVLEWISTASSTTARPTPSEF